VINLRLIFGYLSADRQACLPLPDGRRACPQAGGDRQAGKRLQKCNIKNYLQILMIMITV